MDLNPSQKPIGHGKSLLTVVHTDICVIGSGPVGATYARKLLDAKYRVDMIEIGAQETAIPGDHKKNNYLVQKDINSFINVIQGELGLLSVASDKVMVSAMDPSSWSADPNGAQTIANGQNPEQDAYCNLPFASATRTVGGMGSHWTCCTPRQHTDERSGLFTDLEWDKYYKEAEALLHTNNFTFDKSIRQQLLLNTLNGIQPPSTQEQDDNSHTTHQRNTSALLSNKKRFLPMPLAVQKLDSQSYLEWSCSKTIFGDTRSDDTRFTLHSQCRCTELYHSVGSGENNGILGASCTDLKTGQDFIVKAKKYVLCAGAVLTPGILHNSGFQELPNLGRYLTEQNLAFCQIVYSRKLVEQIRQDPWQLGWDKSVKEHHMKHANDPLPIPFNDLDPQIYSPYSMERPWHGQVHRDAFSYGQVPASVDQRVVLDLRWFGSNTSSVENRVEFSDAITDQFGMPQPTFYYKFGEKDAERAHKMMGDMYEVASKLGGFLPGAEPRFLAPGGAMHITGTTRAGVSPEDSVVNKEGKVWGVDDLFIGGCSVIPKGSASNPTLTAMAFAIAGADKIVKELAPKSQGRN